MSEAPKTRYSLILRLQSHRDAEAWEQFCEVYEPLIMRIARSRGLQTADAEDLVQNAFIRIAKAVQDWDPKLEKGSFRSWVGTIARNLAIDLMRNRSRHPVLAEDLRISEIEESTAESRYFDREYEQQVFVWAASKAKPLFVDSTWAAFWMTAIEMHSPQETARTLNISIGAVYIARSRVIAKLRDIVRNYNGPLNTDHGSDLPRTIREVGR